MPKIEIGSTHYPIEGMDEPTARFFEELAVVTDEKGIQKVRTFPDGKDLRETVEKQGLSLGEGATPQVIGDIAIQHFPILRNGSEIGGVNVISGAKKK